MNHQECEIVAFEASSSQNVDCSQLCLRIMRPKTTTTVKRERSPKSRFFIQALTESLWKVIPFQKEKEKVLVLDLDETLIYSHNQPPKYPAEEIKVSTSKATATFWVRERPGLKSFLQEMSQLFEIVIYTSSLHEYAETIITQLGLRPFISRIFHREHCYRRSDSVLIKDISMVGRDLRNLVLIDDAVHNIEQQPQNSLQITPFKGNTNDKWLTTITPFLKKLSECDDVRSVARKFDLYMLGHKLPPGNCEEVVRFAQAITLKAMENCNFEDELIGSDSSLDISLDEGITSAAIGQIDRLARGSTMRKRISYGNVE